MPPALEERARSQGFRGTPLGGEAKGTRSLLLRRPQYASRVSPPYIANSLALSFLEAKAEELASLVELLPQCR